MKCNPNDSNKFWSFSLVPYIHLNSHDVVQSSRSPKHNKTQRVNSPVQLFYYSEDGPLITYKVNLFFILFLKPYILFFARKNPYIIASKIDHFPLSLYIVLPKDIDMV